MRSRPPDPPCPPFERGENGQPFVPVMGQRSATELGESARRRRAATQRHWGTGDHPLCAGVRPTPPCPPFERGGECTTVCASDGAASATELGGTSILRKSCRFISPGAGSGDPAQHGRGGGGGVGVVGRLVRPCRECGGDGVGRPTPELCPECRDLPQDSKISGSAAGGALGRTVWPLHGRGRKRNFGFSWTLVFFSRRRGLCATPPGADGTHREGGRHGSPRRRPREVPSSWPNRS